MPPRSCRRWGEGAPTTKPLPEPAATFLVRKVREFPGEVTVLAMGPFTNLALASRLDDAFARTAQELVIMGGSFEPHAAKVDEFAMQFIHSRGWSSTAGGTPRHPP